MKILVADDDAVFRKILERKLTGWGFSVVRVADGLKAWGKIQASDRPNLIVLDWMMPGLDGVDVCRRIRQMENVRYITNGLDLHPLKSHHVCEGFSMKYVLSIRKPKIERGDTTN